MSELDSSATPLALVFGDAGASEHVRAMLSEIDARIVYDVGIGELDTSALSHSGATVVLVNLDEVVEEHFDALYASLDDGSYRVVFNDGSRSATLSGWEQARWARHLGAKLRDDVNVDPPRPADAEAVEVAPEDAWMTDALGLLDAADDTAEAPVEAPIAAAVPAPEIAFESDLDPEPGVAADIAHDDLPTTPAATEASAAAALQVDAIDEPDMAADSLEVGLENGLQDGLEDGLENGLESSMQDFLSADTNWSEFDSENTTADVETLAADLDVSELLHAMDEAAAESETEAVPPGVAETAEIDDELIDDDLIGDELIDNDLIDRQSSTDLAWTDSSDEDPVVELAQAEESDPISTTPEDAPKAPESEAEVTPAEIDSSQWALVDYALDEMSEESAEHGGDKVARVDPGAAAAEALASREFGIELMDPIEYLIPEAPVDRGDELFAAPELMSMREALAPVDADAQTSTTDQAATATRLPRLVVLGASIGGPDAVREFLAALPPRFPATFVLVQHLGSEFVDLMITQLGKSSALPVRKAAHLERAVPGEVLVVPRGRQLIISRSGEIELRELPSTSAHDPSINLTMAMAAEVFAEDALGIVFSGMANDAASGALEIAANGGSVWVQDPDHCVVSSMVDAVIAAGVVRFNGTPGALAQRLIDEYGTETPA